MEEMHMVIYFIMNNWVDALYHALLTAIVIVAWVMAGKLFNNDTEYHETERDKELNELLIKARSKF